MKLLVDLLFPRRSLVGGGLLAEGEAWITFEERLALPLTQLGPTSSELRGRFPAEADILFAAAYLWYGQKTSTQALIHHLKYHDRPEVGEVLGAWFAQSLKDELPPVDLLIPVPLDPKRKRDYNQAAHVTMGLSAELSLLWREDVLFKNASTKTQTQKSVAERQADLLGKFSVRPGIDLSGKRIALVDDVLTTGSTLASCALALRAAGAASVGTLTLGATR